MAVKGARISLRLSDSKVHVVSYAVGGSVDGCDHSGGNLAKFKKIKYTYISF